MAKTRRVRRMLALVTAIAAMAVAVVVMLFGGIFLYFFTPGSLRGYRAEPAPMTYGSNPVVVWLILALVLATSGTAALMVYERRFRYQTRVYIYIVFLVIILPITLFNYNQGEAALGYWPQAVLDISLLFLGAAVAGWLASVPVSAPDARVLKALTLFFLLGSTVCIPGLFFILWTLNQVQFLTVAQTESIGWQGLTGLGSVISAVFAWLNYRRGQQQEATASQGPRIL